MTGYCNEVDVYLRISLSNKDKFTSLLKQYGSRNLLFYQLGFDKLNTLEEILGFLQYKFKEDGSYLIINDFSGDRFAVDEQMWIFCAAVIDAGHFKLSKDTQIAVDVSFVYGKAVVK